jgi:hypothetical protein
VSGHVLLLGAGGDAHAGAARRQQQHVLVGLRGALQRGAAASPGVRDDEILAASVPGLRERAAFVGGPLVELHVLGGGETRPGSGGGAPLLHP